MGADHYEADMRVVVDPRYPSAALCPAILNRQVATVDPSEDEPHPTPIAGLG
jgi:hypothetical protein